MSNDYGYNPYKSAQAPKPNRYKVTFTLGNVTCSVVIQEKNGNVATVKGLQMVAANLRLQPFQIQDLKHVSTHVEFN